MQNKLESNLDLLASIRKVETPAYLFERIKNQIQLKKLSRAELRSYAVAAVIILGINILVVSQMNIKKQENTTADYLKNYITENNLYDEQD